MRSLLAVFLVSLTIFGPSQTTFSQSPISKGTWSYKNGKPDTVTFDYGTELTAEDIDRLSGFATIARITMGYVGIDSEYVNIEGDLLKLGRLKNLEYVHLNKDGIVNDELKFLALLPKIHTLEFNAKNGYGGCTDRCADHLSSAKRLRKLLIVNGQFSDEFIDKITLGLQDLEELSLVSPELTDESLRLIAERCNQLKSLSIGSDHFTVDGLKHLDKLKNLKERSVSSPSLRERNDPKEILRLLGKWGYVSVTYEGKPFDVGQDATVTITRDSWTYRSNGETISTPWKIDSTKNPKQLTRIIHGGKVNFLESSIYKLENDRLVICESAYYGRRPEKFVSGKGDEQYLILLRRQDMRKKTEPGK